VFRLPSHSSSRFLAFIAFVAASPLQAVYAPIPEQDQGKEFTITVRAGLSYDTNLFGAASREVETGVFTSGVAIASNVSLSEQTFFSGSYGLTLDYFENRPGDKLLDSHDLSLRLAHAFTRVTTLELNNVFTRSRNPESLLAGVPLNPDQSYQSNQLDGRFVTPLTPKLGGAIKARSLYYNFRDAALGRSLDRVENLFGLAGDYALLPEVKAVAEYRRQEIYYRKLGEAKNKRSDFVLGGLDYELARKFMLSGRLGTEWRQRSSERSTTAPFAELSGKFGYGRDSFVVGGYVHTLDETSDAETFTDMKVNRFFVNVQHQLTGLIVMSGSAGYEPAELAGRRGAGSIDETTTRLGAALSYLPRKNWVASATYDYDRVRSDDAARGMTRQRVGLSARFSF
jgi:hypothetical protein